MNKIALAALSVLGLVLGTLDFAAPAHAATYYYSMSRAHDTNDGGGN